MKRQRKTPEHFIKSLCNEIGVCVLSGESVNKSAMQNICWLPFLQPGMLSEVGGAEESSLVTIGSENSSTLLILLTFIEVYKNWYHAFDLK
jgi:hypothetical protein